MTAGTFLAKLSRKILERGDGEIIEIAGVASGLINPEKELSSSQISEIVAGFDALPDSDDCTELGMALAALIRDA